jgi:endonuclease/exonuclease/phosphatase family metal-dependent hydrolase
VKLRVVTYNIHAGVGTDRRLDLGRIAAVIETSGADVVALQEVDAGRRRSGRVDQAEAVARRLGMDCRFGPSFGGGREGHYGNAILSRLPLKQIRHGLLPGISPWREPRSALHCAVTVDGAQAHVLCTHLSLFGRDRQLQAEALLGREWLGGLGDEAHVLCGDLNCSPGSSLFRRFCGSVRDTLSRVSLLRGWTWPSPWPVRRLDHILIGRRVATDEAEVLASGLARRASDHLPVVATLRLQTERE